MPSLETLRIDGGQGEGGGQIVRTSLVLSLLLQRPVALERIRAGRPKPGLKTQHVSILQLLQQMSASRATGAEVGSSRLIFEPAPVEAGRYRFDVGTAGSLSLLLQTVLPASLLAPGRVELELRGGTDVPWSPTIDWLRHVLLPRLAPLTQIRLEVDRHGFYPAGGGRVRLHVEGLGPDPLPSRVRERLGTPLLGPARQPRLRGTVVVSETLRSALVAERMHKAARAAFFPAGLPTPSLRDAYVESDSPGCSITLWLEDETGVRIGADAIGAPGRRAEDVGRSAAMRLVEDIATGATVDRHLADHWALWVALGAGAVRVPRATGHLTTNIDVCNAFLGPGTVRLREDVLEGA